MYVEGRAEPLRTKIWTTHYVGAQYMPSSLYLKYITRDINATVKDADDKGISVLGLGALNKAEWLNHGGEDIVAQVKPKHTKVAHGNTMTAATTAMNVTRLVEAQGLDMKVFLTGTEVVLAC